jgi:hypothetical protein
MAFEANQYIETAAIIDNNIVAIPLIINVFLWR